jgi:hypothetical protein
VGCERFDSADEAGDYWLFDPEGYSPENPSQLALTFETDKLVNEPATATLKIYDADRQEETPLREITAAATTHGAGQQITRNGKDGGGQLVGKGIYVFDLHVSSDANPLILDSDDHKSQTAGIASTSAEEVGWEPSGLGA